VACNIQTHTENLVRQMHAGHGSEATHVAN